MKQMKRSSKLSEHAKSSVKRFQRGAVPVIGVVDVKITVGDREFEAVSLEQKVNERAGRRYFTPTERDLSKSYKRGSDGTRMPAQRCVLWICKESKRAQDLLCDISIVPLEEGSSAGTAYAIHDDAEEASKNGSIASSATNAAKRKLAPIGVQIVRHKRLPFEIWLRKQGVTPIIDVLWSGRTESKNKWHQHNLARLQKTGYVRVDQHLDNLPAMRDKVVARQRDFVVVDREMMLWTKSVDTKADPKFEMKAITEQLRDGKKIETMANMAMLTPHDLDRLFELFTKIQHYGHEARRRSAKTKLQRKKLDKMQSSVDAFNTMPVDSVHLYLMEPKTCFTEFFWRLIMTSTGDKMHDDLIEEKEQEEERERLMEQVRTGVFTVEGEGIDSQEITFGEFCQAVCRFCMFGEEQILSTVFRLANPEKPANLISPHALIMTLRSIHGNAGPRNHAKQNIHQFGQSIGAFSGAAGSRHVPTLNSRVMVGLHQRYNAILYPAFRFHRAFTAKFLGNKFWNRKKKAFADARRALIESNFL
jgi:hypothetical protein